MQQYNHPYDFVIIGLSISSSWGNGHATTYRSLIKGLNKLGYKVLFLEQDTPWYAGNRDLVNFSFCDIVFYRSPEDLKKTFTETIKTASVVMVGSYVQSGPVVIDWVLKEAKHITAFYDIDTPVTLAMIRAGNEEYISMDQMSKFNLYLSFTGGPILDTLTREFGVQCARQLYCSVDESIYFHELSPVMWDLGYLGTFSPDRQSKLQELLIEPARQWNYGKFIVAGSQYDPDIKWPVNVVRKEHVPPDQHRMFYSMQRFTLNVTRNFMRWAGFAPSVRLFEAAACGTPLISDRWEGIETIFEPGKEILLADNRKEVVRYLKDFPEKMRLSLSHHAREKIFLHHTSLRRANELIGYINDINSAVFPEVVYTQALPAT